MENLARLLQGIFKCPICGKPHVHHDTATHYKAIEIASEQITVNENWKAIPNSTIFSADGDYRLRFESLLS